MSAETILGLILALVACASCGIACYLFFRNRELTKSLSKKTTEIEDASRMLIGKNLELNDQNVKQQKLLESREDFVAIVSHQLRTPATEIRWGINEILEDSEWKLTPEQRTFVERLSLGSEWMVNLIDRLVKLVNFEGPTSTLTSPYAPDEAIRLAAEQITTLFPKKSICLVCELHFDGVLMSIDPDSLKMVISNLVDNAFHYTPEGGTVTVSSACGPHGALIVRVADTGIGISKEKQKSMFVKFQRDQKAVQANEKGMGLGLYVVKKIIEQCGGSITFETEEGKGTTFIVTIPGMQ